MEDNIVKIQNSLRQAKQQGKKIAFCHGCFDVFHLGYLELLSKTKEVADIVVVGIEKDFIYKTMQEKGAAFSERIMGLPRNLPIFLKSLMHSQIIKDLTEKKCSG